MKTSLLSALVAAAALIGPPAADAATTCEATPQGPLCISQVDFAQFAETAYMQQANSQWCWAASISMVFSYYQHPISQPRLVDEVYGGLHNIPASGYTIASKLDGCFADDAGDNFQSRLVAAYDADAGIYAIDNFQIINALDQGRPLVIGTRSHAMVLTAIQYYQTPQGPYVVGAGVFDPWPGNGARALAMDELYPIHLGGSLRFLALPHVSDVAGACPVAPYDDDYEPGGCAASGGTAGAGWLLGLGLVIGGLSRRRARAASACARAVPSTGAPRCRRRTAA